MKKLLVIPLIVFASLAARAQSINEIQSILCSGDSTGSLQADPSTWVGGVGPFGYIWNTGDSVQTISNLPAAVYSVTITDSGNALAQAFVSYSLTEPTALGTIFSITNNVCFGDVNGAVDQTVSGGTGGYTFSWGGPNGFLAATEDLTNIESGWYYDTITDANSCVYTDSIFVGPPQLLASYVVTNVTICFGNSNGAIDITLLGGTGPYTFSWLKNGSIFPEITEDISGITAGTYQVTIKDACDSVYVISNIVVGEPPLVTITEAFTQVSCNNGSDGTWSFFPTGATGPYSISFNGGPPVSVNSGFDAGDSNLVSGTYSSTIIDANGCTWNYSRTFAQPLPIVVVPSITNSNCYGESNGSIDLQVNGGTPGFSFGWTGPNGFVSVLQNISGLSPGIYTFTVTDNNNCTSTGTVELIQPMKIQGYVVSTDVSCNGGSNGSAQAIYSGGTGPLSYNWSTGDATITINTLSSGVYYLTITDSLGCQHIDSAVINQPASAISFTVNSETDVTICYGNSNGAIDMNTSGGTSPYTYTWFLNGNLFPNVNDFIFNIPAGTYDVIVTDAEGCTDAVNGITVDQPLQVNIFEVYTDVSCNNGNDGTWTFTPVGATGPYDVSFNGGPATSVASGTAIGDSNLAAGTYTATIVDANLCTWNYTRVFSQPLPIVVMPTVVNNICYGESNGSINLQVNGGTPGYGFNWTGPNGFTSLLQNISGLVAGDYTYTVSDPNSCTATGTVQLFQPMKIQGHIGSTDVTCNGGSNGSAQAVYSGGTGPLSYNWSTGDTTAIITALSNGIYYLTVTDSLGCTLLDSATISQPGAAISFTSNPVINVTVCFGNSNGAIDMNTAGGTPPYTYTWLQNGNLFNQVTEDITNITAGTYDVTVTDAAGCTAAVNGIIVTEPPQVIITEVFTGISCNNGNDGTWTFTPTGATGPYDVSFNGGPATSVASGTAIGDSNLSAGTYTATIVDANLCTWNYTRVFSQPLPIVVMPTVVNNICYGESNGSINLQVNGGTPGYGFSWTGPNGFTSLLQNISGLVAGDYTYTISDPNNCTATGTVQLFQPMKIQGHIGSTDVTCNGGSNGSAQAVYSGGTGPLAFNWSTGDTTAIITALSNGVYYLTVTDSLGCTLLDSATISQPGAAISFTSNPPTNVTVCFGNSNGAIDMNTAGGTPPYTYTWLQNGSLFNQVTEDITNITAGTYDVTVTDAAGCTAAVNGIIVTEPPQVIITEVFTEVSCNNGNDGTWTFTPTGATGPYDVSFNGGPATSVASGTAIGDSNLSAGTYTATIVDANLCTWNYTRVFSQPLPIVVIPTVINNNCYGESNGSINLQVNGGTPGYGFSWTGPNGFTSLLQNISGLVAGDYTYTISDPNNCTATGTVQLFQPMKIQGHIGSTDVTCNGGSNGSAQAVYSGGTGPLAFNWSTGDTTAIITALSNGVYYLTVTDSLGCTLLDSATISQPGAAISFTSNPPTNVTVCFGNSNGAIDMNTAGGTPPYTYTWLQNGNLFNQVTEDITNITAGTYDVTVTDAAGCTAAVNGIIVTEPPQVIITEVFTGISCNNGNDGTWTFTPTGATGPYDVSFNGGPATSVASGTAIGDSNLSASTYTATIVDANLCTWNYTRVFIQPLPIVVIPTVINNACYGTNNGGINLQVNGGTPAYTYSWTGPYGFTSSSQNISNLAAGGYAYVITDANNCTIAGNLMLSEPIVIQGFISSTNVNCNGGSNGSAVAVFSGGTGNLYYNWSNGDTTETITGLSAGNYFLTVTDSLGCTLLDTVNITEPATPLSLTTTLVTPVTVCFGNSNGAIDMTTAGGTPPYTYSWLLNGNLFTGVTEDLNNISAGTYDVTVTDAAGCTTAVNGIIVTEPPQVTITEVFTEISCNNGSNGTWTFTPVGATAPYSISFNGSPPVLVLSGTSLGDSTLAAGTYTCTIMDANGCTWNYTRVFNQPLPIVVTTTVIASTCFGETNGAINLQVNGGAPGYTFTWTGPFGFTSALQNISNLASGFYTYTVTDANSCNVFGDIQLVQPMIIQGYLNATNVTCNGGSNGMVQAVYSGGSGNLNYSWSNGDTTEIITNLTAGNYYLTVTDSLGCIALDSVNITEPALPLTLTTTLVTPVTVCFGNSNGAIDMTTAGGTPPYSYTWIYNGNLYSGITEDLINLQAGTYDVTVTDAAGCTAAVNGIIVTEPPQVIITEIFTDISCNNGNDGSWTFTAVGLTGPYAVSFNGGAAVNYASGVPAVLNNIVAGIYTCTIVDANGCTWNYIRTFNQPLPIVVISTIQNNLCYGETNGSIILQVNGGTPGYTFNWLGPVGFSSTAQNLFNLPPGDYTYTISDTNSCTVTGTVHLAAPMLIQGFISTSSIACFGDTNAYAQANFSGGTGPLAYLWSTTETTPIINGLAPGIYYLTVTDSLGCQATDSAIVGQPGAPLTLALDTIINVSVCNGYSNGAINITTTGGTPPYSYTWVHDGLLFLQITEDIFNIPAGTYTVTVTDHVGCSAAINSIVVTEPPLTTLTEIYTNISCNNGSDGSWSVTPTGGTGPYNVTFNTVPPTILVVNSGFAAVVNNLTAGIYTCTVIDVNTCTTVLTHTFIQPMPIVVAPTVVNNLCYGDTNGSITLQINGGTPGYTVSWTGPNGFTSTQQNITGLESGDYNFTVTDTNSCTVSGSVHVYPLMMIQGHISYNDVTCYGGSNGYAEAIYSGGTGLLTYQWSNLATTPVITNLTAGTFYLTITDEHGCLRTDSVVISEPAAILITLNNVADVTCYGFSDGSINLTTTGGVGPYTFTWWHNGLLFNQVTEDLSNVPAGNYHLIVTDTLGCIASADFIVNEPTQTTFTNVATPISCNNGADGTWSITAIGAYGPYQYIFSTMPPTVITVPSGTPAVVNSLIAGSYTCTVFATNGCTWNFTQIFDQPLPFIVQPVVQHNICYTDTNGMINLQINGGNPLPNYTVTWTGPNGFISNSFVITNLESGDYFYIATDGNSCTDTGQVRIDPQMPVQGYISKTDVSCFGGHSGIAQAVFSGGYGYLNYSWSNGLNTPVINALAAGTYTLTVTDSAGCQLVSSVTLNQPPDINITVNLITDVSCYGYNDGAIDLTVSGGTGPLHFSWLYNGNIFPVVTEDLNNIYAGVYNLTVSDSVGCNKNASFTVNQPLPTFFIDSVHKVSCNNGADGYWSIEPIGIDTAYIAIFSTGDTISTDTVPAPHVNNLSAGNYTCVITGSNGCQYTFTLSLSQPLPIVIGLQDINPVICFGDSTGSIQLYNIHGGTKPYKYLWSDGQTTNPAVNLPAGYYTVTVRDSLNCPQNETYEVEGPFEPIKFFPTIVGTSCIQSNDGSIVLFDHDIYWSPYQNFFILQDSAGNPIDTLLPGEIHGGLTAGLYIGTVYNQYGCFKTDTLLVKRGDNDCLVIPNLVTPNADSYNDVFRVQGACNYDATEVYIFTDDGIKVYDSQDCNFAWDPLDDHKISTNTVFYYYIKVTKDEQTWEYRNSINVNY